VKPCNLASLAAAGGLLLFTHSAAWAQHGHTMLVVSDANGAGQLELAWDFDGMPIARTADSGLPGIFTGNVPGFNDGTGDGAATFTLTNGTEISNEVTAMDEGLRWIFGEAPDPVVPIDEPFETAPVGTMPTLHNHATFEQTTTDASTFAEGRISFRVFDSSASPVYGASEVRTLVVSNGYLPPFETASEDDLKCQKAVTGAARNFGAKVYQLLGKCVDAVLAHTMLGKSENPALKKCSIDDQDDKSLVSKIAEEKQKAIDKIAKKCGPLLDDSSTPYTLSHIQTHLGMVQCRGEELAGATYNHAASMIGEVLEAASLGDHHDVQHAFPCMKASIE
jgi:hypothetical protein